MKKLLCAGNEIFIEDFLEGRNEYTIDAKFQNKEEFEKFINLYEKYGFEKGIFRFEIGGKGFSGWFGQMMYDRNYNVRVYVGVYDENERYDRNVGGKAHSVGKSVLGIGKAMRELCDILNEKGILNQEQKDKILGMMNTPETMTELRDLMEDLPLYLKSSHATIEILKSEDDKSGF